jgi:hypothetical protein
MTTPQSRLGGDGGTSAPSSTGVPWPLGIVGAFIGVPALIAAVSLCEEFHGGRRPAAALAPVIPARLAPTPAATLPGIPARSHPHDHQPGVLIELDASMTVRSTPSRPPHSLALRMPLSALRLLTFDKPETQTESGVWPSTADLDTNGLVRRA